MSNTAVKDGGSKQATMPRTQGPVENPGDPRGKFAEFLRAWVDEQVAKRNRRLRKGDTADGKTDVIDDLASALGIERRAVQKWLKGTTGPSFGDLDTVAVALGFDSFAKLAKAIEEFC